MVLKCFKINKIYLVVINANLQIIWSLLKLDSSGPIILEEVVGTIKVCMMCDREEAMFKLEPRMELSIEF